MCSKLNVFLYEANFVCLQLKMWITFLIPKIEDGNNFGVSIQEDTLGEIRTVEAEAATFYEQISRYFITRGKIISKVCLTKAHNDNQGQGQIEFWPEFQTFACFQ